MGSTPIAESRFGDMMSNSGLTPWHGVGTVIDGFCDGAKALELARINWTVRKGSIIDADTFEAVPNRYVLKADFDDGTSAVIGEANAQIVSETYEILQNSELGDIADHLGLNVQTAGSMWDGRFVWMLIDLGESPMFDGTAEAMHRWLLISTWHGSGAFRIEGVNIRVVCENTLKAAQVAGELYHSIRHTSNASYYLDAAKKALHEAYIGFDKFDAWALSLMNEPYSTDDMRRELVPAVLGKFPTGQDATDRQKKAAAEKRAALKRIWNSDTVAPNKWGAIQAVNEYEQHVAGKPSFERTARKFVKNDFPMTNKAIAVLA